VEAFNFRYMKKIPLIIGAGVNKEINTGVDLGIELLHDISDRVPARTSPHNTYLSSFFNKKNIKNKE